MKPKSLLTISALLLGLNTGFAQFIVKSTFMETTGVSNQGLVAGYYAQGGVYSLWNPDSATTRDIDGLAPGFGVGGQARFSDDGTFLCGTSRAAAGAEMSRFDYSTGLWTTLGSLGFPVDSTFSGGYGISGDGNTVVGNSWADTTGGHAYTHAVAWNPIEGVMDLGSLFSANWTSARANAVSGDGNIVVGWQDFNGPWKSAVWRKDPAGGYFANEYLLIDTNGSATDEFNQLGECSAVSSDGNWIGGYGDYANNGEPWIWSQSTGVINLGLLPGALSGNVAGISSDGSVVVGWQDGFFGDPQQPFIWTPTGGMKNLNDYINYDLGYSTGTNQIYTANCMSSNGEYVAGFGVDTSNFSYFAYRAHLVPSTGVDELHSASISVYPNPAANSIRIINAEKSSLTIVSLEGKIVYKAEVIGNATIDVSKFAKGIYQIILESGTSIRRGRFVKE